MKTRVVRVFPTGDAHGPTEITSVVSTGYRDGLFSVEQESGTVYRFPIHLIAMVTEQPS